MLARLAVLFVLLFASAPAEAARTTCPDRFVGEQAPDLLNAELAARTRELCYSGFAVLHSGVTRTPLWSAEHLTRAHVNAAHDLIRVNRFHADPHLPAAERAELADYARSGFDRGHMAPSGDMPDPQSQEESFSLANMIPQNPNNNRSLWEGIESAVRNLTRKQGELYVVTGPIYAGATLQQLNGRVLVPTSIFKAVYDPKRQQAGAYIVPNAAGDRWEAVSLAELARISGLDVFPALPASIKDNAMALPQPTLRHRESVERSGESSRGRGRRSSHTGRTHSHQEPVP
jgi:endonuclease G